MSSNVFTIIYYQSNISKLCVNQIICGFWNCKWFKSSALKHDKTFQKKIINQKVYRKNQVKAVQMSENSFEIA